MADGNNFTDEKNLKKIVRGLREQNFFPRMWRQHFFVHMPPDVKNELYPLLDGLDHGSNPADWRVLGHHIGIDPIVTKNWEDPSCRHFRTSGTEMVLDEYHGSVEALFLILTVMKSYVAVKLLEDHYEGIAKQVEQMIKDGYPFHEPQAPLSHYDTYTSNPQQPLKAFPDDICSGDDTAQGAYTTRQFSILSANTPLQVQQVDSSTDASFVTTPTNSVLDSKQAESMELDTDVINSSGEVCVDDMDYQNNVLTADFTSLLGGSVPYDEQPASFNEVVVRGQKERGEFGLEYHSMEVAGEVEVMTSPQLTGNIGRHEKTSDVITKQSNQASPTPAKNARLDAPFSYHAPASAKDGLLNAPFFHDSRPNSHPVRAPAPNNISQLHHHAAWSETQHSTNNTYTCGWPDCKCGGNGELNQRTHRRSEPNQHSVNNNGNTFNHGHQYHNCSGSSHSITCPPTVNLNININASTTGSSVASCSVGPPSMQAGCKAHGQHSPQFVHQPTCCSHLPQQQTCSGNIPRPHTFQMSSGTQLNSSNCNAERHTLPRSKPSSTTERRRMEDNLCNSNNSRSDSSMTYTSTTLAFDKRKTRVFVTYTTHEHNGYMKLVRNLIKCLKNNEFTVACPTESEYTTYGLASNVSQYMNKFHEADYVVACVSDAYLSDISAANRDQTRLSPAQFVDQMMKSEVREQKTDPQSKFIVVYFRKDGKPTMRLPRYLRTADSFLYQQESDNLMFRLAGYDKLIMKAGRGKLPSSVAARPHRNEKNAGLA